MPLKLHNEFFAADYFNKAYSYRMPPTELSRWVEYIWYSCFDKVSSNINDDFHEQLFAHLSSSLVYTYGSPFIVKKEGAITKVSEAVVVGQHTVPITYHHDLENKLVGLKLKPGGFYGLLGISASLIQNQIIPLSEFKMSKTSPQNIEMLLEVFCNNSRHADLYKYHCVQNALELYKLSLHENLHIDYIAKKLHVTPRTMTRYFSETLGITPKKAFTISRLRTALKEYAENKKINRRFSVYSYGYTDCSHFYKELITYTSLHSLRH